MIALSPRFIGAEVNLDQVQFFTDYCNSMILTGNFYSTGYQPTFKAVAMSMDVAMTSQNTNETDTVHHFDLSSVERNMIETSYTKQGWFTTFTTRALIEESLPKLNVESADILNKLLNTLPADYPSAIFILATFKFGTPEESIVAQPSEGEEAVSTVEP